MTDTDKGTITERIEGFVDDLWPLIPRPAAGTPGASLIALFGEDLLRTELTKIVVDVVVEGKSVQEIQADLAAMLGLDDIDPGDILSAESAPWSE